MSQTEEIQQALALLDANVAKAEARYAQAETNLRVAATELNEARAVRRGADMLAALMRGHSDGMRETPREQPSIQPHADEVGGVPRGINTGLTHVVERVMRNSGGIEMTVDDVMAVPEVSAIATSRQQVRNGLHYLGRKKIIEKAGARGTWRFPTNDFGPALEAGPIKASENGTSTQEVVLIGAFGPSQPVG